MFAIRLGQREFPVALPVLAGVPLEDLFPGANLQAEDHGFTLLASGPWLVGHSARRPGADLATTTQALYGELLRVAAGHHLARIWNYVPAINAPGVDGLENYRAFSRGRSLAFEQTIGPDFKRLLPAASAVGGSDERLTVVFAAHRRPPLHRENPRQVPAYDYPEEHGPRPPSFARASIVPADDGRRDIFISGTSAILGHATIAPDDTMAQTRCTIDNLRAIGGACGLDASCGAGSRLRHVKVYLRHASERPLVARLLEAEFLLSGDLVTYLGADICRAALNVEIEVTILGAAA